MKQLLGQRAIAAWPEKRAVSLRWRAERERHGAAVRWPICRRAWLQDVSFVRTMRCGDGSSTTLAASVELVLELHMFNAESPTTSLAGWPSSQNARTASIEDASLSGELADAGGLVWHAVPDYPLDLNGPVDRPFEELSEGFSASSAFEHLERIVALHGSKLAVSDGKIQLTYSELLSAVVNLAGMIAALVPEGQAFGLLLGNSAWYPVTMLAAMAAARPALSLNPRDPPRRLTDVLEGAGLSVVVSDQADLVARLNLEGGQWLDPSRCLSSAPEALGPLPRKVSTDAPALILQTSGSTGAPKGIVNSQRGLLERVRQAVNACHIGPDDVFMPLTGPATIAGCREMLTATLSGATLHLVDVESAGIRQTRQWIQSRGITMTYVVPALLRLLMKDAEAETFSSLRVVRVGGEIVLWSDIDVIRRQVSDTCFIQVSYSSTETIGTQWFLPRDFPEQGATVPVGYLAHGIDYAVVAEHGGPVAPDGEGELWIRSRSVMLGYWEEGGVASLPTTSDGARILATKDLVRVDERGLTRVIGRKGRLLKINGRRVEPAELELVLRRAPHVREAVAIVTDDHQIVAFVIAEEGAAANLIPALRDLIRASLPGAVHPVRMHGVREIPRLRGGKVDAAALRIVDAAMADARPAALPETRSEPDDLEEAAVAAVWSAILRRSVTAGRWDEAGGDSLSLLQLVMELENRLDRELNLDAFTVDMTFADIVRAASATPHDQPSEAEAGGLPMLFMLPGSIGYGPSLAAFGVEMRDVARVVALRYPDLEEVLAGKASIAVMADLAFEEICRVQPEGDLALIGYSLGGAVAFEVAGRLAAVDRTVRFLGILDTNIEPAGHAYRETIARTAQRIRTHRMSIDRLLWRAIAKTCVRFGQEVWLARCIGLMTWRSLAQARFLLRLELEDILRMRAFWRWLKRPQSRLTVTATLFRCNRQHLSPDLGWGKLLSHLEVVPIAGGHLDMLIEPHLGLNRPLIAHALQSVTE
jgi:acyl-coenzyme A synthetase/AMP-(fatty) acid ligase/thioesterase domain-containing protein